MSRLRLNSLTIVAYLAFAAMSLLQARADDALATEQFLASVSAAVNEANYRGTLIRTANGRMDAMQILHSNEDGFVREKLVAMDGEGREIIRNGNELICLLPNRQIKIVDANSVASNAFARLQSASRTLGNFYSLVPRGTDRVTGRKALRYDLNPIDGYRYGHRFWIDAATSLPLRMQLVSRNLVIEEIRFVEVEIGVTFAADDFNSDIDSRGFTVMQGAMTAGADDVQSEMTIRPVGALADIEESLGFQLNDDAIKIVEINGRRSKRMVFSDGLAAVSVFVEQRPGNDNVRSAQLASMGAAHTYQHRVGGLTVTVVGDVPAETVKYLAEKAGEEWQTGFGGGETTNQ